jgi:hypothetical protein
MSNFVELNRIYAAKEEDQLGFIIKKYEYDYENFNNTTLLCNIIIGNDQEQKLFDNKHDDLEDSVFIYNNILNLTLYHDGKNKLEKREFEGYSEGYL